jgi:hypothetical protein
MGSDPIFDIGDARTGTGELPQDFTKFFYGRCHVALCGSGDADGPHLRRAREWAVEQAFAIHSFE